MSDAQPERSRKPMLLVAERMEPDAPSPPVAPQESLFPPDSVKEYRAWKAAALGTINVLAAVLAVRLILLVSVGGAIFLAWLAQDNPYRIGAVGVYTASVVLPVVWLSSRR